MQYMKFNTTYLSLPEIFYRKTNPVPVKAPKFAVLNRDLAEDIGLDLSWLTANPAIFSGNELVPGSTPIAKAYAGHQFGHFTLLGDGRAHLLGEIVDHMGKRWDIELKGSGHTPFSRGGDGRAALGPMLREYLISEAMYALGIPTTRSLAVVSTGESVFRETTLPGAVLTRVAASHIRVGTFEFAAASDKHGAGRGVAVKALADYTIARHYPEIFCPELEYSAQHYQLFLDTVIERQAQLIAQWMCVGFIHGVMNTDNMSISGETIDYGPCAFMDYYDPATVFSSIDRQGRYAYGNQVAMAQWNLTRFAESLLPLLNSDQKQALEIAEKSLSEFAIKFQRHHLDNMRAKLGLSMAMPEDENLIQELLNWMHSAKQDFTQTFSLLSRGDGNVAGDLRRWNDKWRQRISAENRSLEDAKELMIKSNPVIIPRNHLVERYLSQAVMEANYQGFETYLKVLRRPFEETPENLAFRYPEAGHAQSYKTFCGT
jgi:uncharacterized protein YdiU (UPF0061 family)